MVILQHVDYTHPGKDVLFNDINFVVNRHQKVALVGNNGAGKSTLLKLIAGVLQTSSGKLHLDALPYYVPQHYGQYNDMTVAEALGVQGKLTALRQILEGEVTADNMTMLDDDWGIEERCTEALAQWELHNISMSASMNELSGGQKTKVFLSGIAIHSPALVLMDEPGNHLDTSGREGLYKLIASYSGTLIVVSHDRKLLNRLNTIYELDKDGVTVYGGNYDFYREQKILEENALHEELKSKEKALRKAKDVQRETIERQQKLDARGKKKQEKSGTPTIMMNTLRNLAERSTSKTKNVHAEKVEDLTDDVNKLRKSIPDRDKMKIVFDDAQMPRGKELLTATGINYSYGGKQLWTQPLIFEVFAGDRIAIKGNNGTGKTTLVKLMTKRLEPQEGAIVFHRQLNSIYIDQEYSLLDREKTVFEQAEYYNSAHREVHEVRSRLSHFLFSSNDLDKYCDALSGGEKMRLILCCLTLGDNTPDMIILDEPTNNLDIQNIEILTNAIEDYAGTVIVISHDEQFLTDVRVTKGIILE